VVAENGVPFTVNVKAATAVTIPKIPSFAPAAIAAPLTVGANIITKSPGIQPSEMNEPEARTMVLVVVLTVPVEPPAVV
jgi:hypothetical protein